MKKVFCRERREENGRGEEETKRREKEEEEKERKEEERRKSFCFRKSETRITQEPTHRLEKPVSGFKLLFFFFSCFKFLKKC